MNSQKVKIGVLALQGAIEEHVSMTSRAFKSMNVDGEVLWVKRPEHLEEIRGLISSPARFMTGLWAKPVSRPWSFLT